MKKILNYTKQEPFIPVDNWKPTENDIIFRHLKDEFIVPISQFLNVPENMRLDCFSLKPKRAYKRLEARQHFCHYLNYFEKFYDKDRELVAIYSQIKCMIDGSNGEYTKELLKQDLERYLLSDSIKWKAHRMNEDNYIPLRKKYEYKKSGLEYNNEHCKYMLYISLLQNMMIPILTHYIFVNEILDVNMFLLEMYDILLYMKGASIDLYNKFYETVKSSTEHNVIVNPIWGQQDIRGINPTTFAIDSTNNIILNLIYKYEYSGGPVAMNLKSVKTNIKYQVVENKYEYTFIKLDTTKKDEDSNSEFDKFESYTAKQDESLYIELNHIATETMKMIDKKYGPFPQDEIEFYKARLFDEENDNINTFQRNLVFNLFYKYFGDTESIKAINKDDYIKLVIAAKNMLISNDMVVLPYVISSKVTKSISRKNINKKEEGKVESCEIFSEIMEKYSYNPKIKQYILSLIATIFSSTFNVIDYHDPNIDGKDLPLLMDFIQEEVCRYVRLI